MAIMKYWDNGSSKWIPFDAGDAATLGGKAPSEFASASHVGRGGAAHALAIPNGEAGFFSGVDKAKLDTIQMDAQKNQSAFSHVRIGNKTFHAGSPSSAFEFVSGNNIQLTLDSTNGKLTIGTDLEMSGSTSPGGREPELLAKTDANGRVGDSERVSGKTLYELDLRYASSGSGGGTTGDGEALFSQQLESETLNADSSKVVVPVTGYDQAKHILFAYRNGLYLQLGQDYTIDNTDGSINKISGTWPSGSLFDFLVMGISSSGDMLKVHQYETFAVATQGQTHFSHNIPEYIAGYDAMNVYYNGLRLAQGQHYTVSGDGTQVILTGYTADAQAELQFVVLKKKA